MRFLRKSLTGLFLLSLTLGLLGFAGIMVRDAVQARMAEEAAEGGARRAAEDREERVRRRRGGGRNRRP